LKPSRTYHKPRWGSADLSLMRVRAGIGPLSYIRRLAEVLGWWRHDVLDGLGPQAVTGQPSSICENLLTIASGEDLPVLARKGATRCLAENSAGS
jgi:hypothetical protein